MDHIEERFERAQKWLRKFRNECQTDYNDAVANRTEEEAEDIGRHLQGVEESFQIVTACADTEWWILEQMGGGGTE